MNHGLCLDKGTNYGHRLGLEGDGGMDGREREVVDGMSGLPIVYEKSLNVDDQGGNGIYRLWP